MKTTISKNLKVSLSTIISILFWIILLSIYLLDQKSKDLVVFLDVGQGDSILIQQGNTQMLVDGGPDRSVLYELPKYMPFFDRNIEYILLTHPHDDHLTGILYILENYNVGEILYYPVCYDNNNYEMLLSNPVKKREIGKGDTIRLDTFNVNILWPREGVRTPEGCYKSFDGNINNDSIVLSFEYINRSFLLMGDAEKEVEQELITGSNTLGKYDVLKAGHHCSKTSTSETFLQQISVEYAVCSCGYKNMYGHPSSETLEKFSKYSVQYLVTYEEGNIVIGTEDIPKL